MAELSVGISANIDNLKKSLSDGENALNQFSLKAEKITKSLKKNAISSSKLSTQIDGLKSSFSAGNISQKKFENSLNSLQKAELKVSSSSKMLRGDLLKVNQASRQLGGGGMNKLKKGTISGNSAMTAFSRTVQDAPFGIMGVSNNITNLTEQFGYLKNKTGSAGGALKAMLRDLKGFGGISLAISVATSLMLVFSKEIGKLFNKAKKLETAFKDSSESIGNQIKKLTDLTEALVDNNTSTENKVKILAKLKKEYPKYFSNLSVENANINTVTKAYLKQKNAIIGLGVTKALESKKAPEYAKLAELELKSQAQLLSATDKMSFASLGSSSGGYGGGANKDAENIAKRIKELAKISKEKQITAIMKNIADIDKAADKIKKRFNVSDLDLLGLSKGVSGGDDDSVDFGMFFDNVLEDFDLNKDRVQELIDLDPITIADNLEGKSIDWEAYFNNKSLAEQTELLKQKLTQFNEQANQIITGSIAETFGQLGSAIGEALVGGGNVLQAIGQTILQGLGQFLSNMGGMLIEYGTLAVVKGKLDLAIAVGGPLAIGAGIAAIAVGVALKAAGAAFSSAGSSVGSGGGVNSSTSSYSPSGGGSGGGGGGGGGGTYVFEIQGTKLVGVLSNTLRRNRSLGGSLNII